MSTDDTTDGTADGPPPVLPHAGAANPALDRLVRENLRRLAEVTEDPGLRRRMREVVDGRASLRELAFSGDFQAFLEPLVESGLEHWQRLPEAEREAYAEQGLHGNLPVQDDGTAGDHGDGTGRDDRTGDGRTGDGVGRTGDGVGRDGEDRGGRGPAGTW
ncbi:MAG TPA: hypothetical protein VFM86_00875 [Pedococcus sp.]|nr:hypothetical protein [Pedococcus sp.]